MNELLKTKITIFKVETSPKELLGVFVQNYCYGFVQMIVPTMISIGYDLGVFSSMLVYYIFLSSILNRKAYTTMLGKYILFPGAAALGGYSGYKFAMWLAPLLT